MSYLLSKGRQQGGTCVMILAFLLSHKIGWPKCYDIQKAGEDVKNCGNNYINYNELQLNYIIFNSPLKVTGTLEYTWYTMHSLFSDIE